jgi:hypothetical protein
VGAAGAVAQPAAQRHQAHAAWRPSRGARVGPPRAGHIDRVGQRPRDHRRAAAAPLLDELGDQLRAVAAEWQMPIVFSTHPRTRKRIEALGDALDDPLIRLLPRDSSAFGPILRTLFGHAPVIAEMCRIGAIIDLPTCILVFYLINSFLIHFINSFLNHFINSFLNHVAIIAGKYLACCEGSALVASQHGIILSIALVTINVSLILAISMVISIINHMLLLAFIE